MRCAGSSLLPICRDRRYGNIYFLLGRERRHPQWIDSDQWADFSGSTKTTNGVEESSEETAAREAWEETAAIVKFRNQFETVPVPGYDSLMSDLVNENFILKIEFNDFGSKYVTYVYEIPWDPSIPQRFQHVMKLLTQRFPHARATNESERLSNTGLRALFRDKQHPSINRENGHCDRSFTEKAAIGLFSVPQLVKAIQNNGVIIEKFGRREKMRENFGKRLSVILNQLSNSLCFQPYSLTGAESYSCESLHSSKSNESDKEPSSEDKSTSNNTCLGVL